MTTQSIKRKIAPILQRQGVSAAALFGSTARGEAGRDSDIDLLIKLKKGKTLLDVVRLKLELEKNLAEKLILLSMTQYAHFLKNQF